ncbi:MAG: NTP transferase domain-containing protein [Flavobacteriaceae bacterium]|nr:NTP transferase domain-containing protein [Flavobacteriaceae bacterium]
MKNWKNNIIASSDNLEVAISRLNDSDTSIMLLFVVDEQNKLIGTISDGDIRRTLVAKSDLSVNVLEVMSNDFSFLEEGEDNQPKFLELEGTKKNIVPVLNKKGEIVDVFNLLGKKGLLSVDVAMMAGGKGERLMPLTEKIPKPLLVVGDKPIIEHNIDRLSLFGVKKFNISINYLGEQLEDYFGDGSSKEINISYQKEKKRLGTIGSASLIESYSNDIVLVMNSDILTDIDYSDFYREFLESKADMLVATIPYHVDIPYGVLEMSDGVVVSLKEKPRYTYYSNAGIYLIKKNILEALKKEEHYDATDLIEDLIKRNKKVSTYTINTYWLDIGKHADFEKAQQDVKHLNLL